MGDRPIQDSDCLVRQEQQALRNWRIHRGREHEPWTGIALSGGGIRSATFCLGVLQALANRDHLKHFDYMSTVSGGGYIGCSLQWWWYQPDPISRALPQDKNSNNKSLHGQVEGELGTTKSNFPFGTSEPGPSHSPRDDIPKSARLNNLRHHGNYLAPGRLINYFSLLGAILRAIALNLLVWIPLIGFTFYAIHNLPLKDHLKIADAFEPWLPPDTPILYPILLLAAGGVVMFFILACAFYSLQTWDSQEGKRQDWEISKALLLFVAMLASVVAFFFVLKSSPSDFEIVQIWGSKPDIHIILLPLLLVAALVIAALLWKATALELILRRFPEGVGEAYAYRRMIDKSSGLLFPFFIMIVAFGLIPIIFEFVRTASPQAGVLGGVFAVGIGTATALWGYYQLFRNLAPKLATTVFLPVGGAVFLVGVAILGFYFGVSMQSGNELVKIVLLVLVFFGIASALMVNINEIGLNRFYRDRLMEAYLPNKDVIEPDKEEPSQADSVYLWKLWGSSHRQPPGPYPLINTNVVLVNDSVSKFRQRGGDNFVLSPHFCGSTATCWHKTEEALPDISLPTAMAASAAAVNPFTGYVGTGPTRGRIVSVVMALLNLRLGLWVRNPAKSGQSNPNHIVPGLWYVLTRRGHRHNNHFLALTDGGHFDNLGIYELVRRKCKLILVCDGEMDRKTAYEALVSVQRRIKDDFGARIIFDPDQGPERLVESIKMNYPSDALMAAQTYFVATIEYQDGSNGKIIYVKARMIKELSFEVKAYKGAYPDFPHETTSDQFFDPEQFDAHCELGYRACICADPSIEAALEAQAMVSRAVGCFQKNGKAAFDLISSDSEGFRSRDLYVFVHSTGRNAKVVAYGGPPVHPSPIGTLSRHLVDSEGRPVGQMLQERARADGVWIDYTWVSPRTGKPEKKSSWVVCADGYIFDCGFYNYRTDAQQTLALD